MSWPLRIATLSKATLSKGVPIPSGYAAIRIGSPVSYQTLIIGGAGSAPRVLVPVGG